MSLYRSPIESDLSTISSIKPSLKKGNSNQSFISNETKRVMFYLIGLLVLFFLLWCIRRLFKETFDQPSKLDSYFKKTKLKLDEPTNENDEGKKKKESKGERLAKKTVEAIFGVPFTKVRPNMLKNKVTGYNLELDVFNEDLGLAIEYNGQQHYKYVPFFHKNYEHFLNQKYRDEIKRMLCTQNGIKLIEIHYLTPFEEFETVIRTEARRFGYDV
jgi:hypothetical protein